MTINRNSAVLGLAAVIMLPALDVAAKSDNAVTIRPIEDFLSRQGTWCLDTSFNGAYTDPPEIVDGDFVGNCPTETAEPPFLFVPPIANYFGFSDPDRPALLSIDYAGLADYWALGAFGTTIPGRVIERPLADGRAQVKVQLRTTNALTYVTDWDGTFEGDEFAVNELLFGARADDVVDEYATPAFGDVSLTWTFINTAPGDPLPDLLQLANAPEPGQEGPALRLSARAKGPLREGFGVEDGTPGSMHSTEVGLTFNPQCGADSPSAVADCFPVERIDLKVVGR